MLLRKCTLNTWESFFPLGAVRLRWRFFRRNCHERLKFQAHGFVYQQSNPFSRYLKRDPRQREILCDNEKASSVQIQARLDCIACEYGDTYIDGIQPVSDAL
jgi:fatty acid synthase subunit alpha